MLRVLFAGRAYGTTFFLVVQAAADQRLVGVAFEEADQHFHADPWDGDAAVMGAGPGGGDAQPAAGLVVGLAFAVPVELHFDAAVLVAVDFFTFGPGDHGALAAEDPWFGVVQRRAVRYVPGSGLEAVAVALVEIVLELGRVAGDRLFQHLRLFAFVEDFGEQPQVVPFGFRVLGQRQEVAADQQRLIAFAFGELEVATVTL